MVIQKFSTVFKTANVLINPAEGKKCQWLQMENYPLLPSVLFPFFTYDSQNWKKKWVTFQCKAQAVRTLLPFLLVYWVIFGSFPLGQDERPAHSNSLWAAAGMWAPVGLVQFQWNRFLEEMGSEFSLWVPALRRKGENC